MTTLGIPSNWGRVALAEGLAALELLQGDGEPFFTVDDRSFIMGSVGALRAPDGLWRIAELAEAYEARGHFTGDSSLGCAVLGFLKHTQKRIEELAASDGYMEAFAQAAVARLEPEVLTESEVTTAKANLRASLAMRKTLLYFWHASDKVESLRRLGVEHEGVILERIDSMNLSLTELRHLAIALDLVIDYEVSSLASAETHDDGGFSIV